MNAIALTTLGTVFAVAVPTWGMLYHTDLETPDFKAGQQLVGQSGWVNLISPKAATVVSNPALAASGRRAVECYGGGPLETIPGPYLLGAWEQQVAFDALTDPAIVRVECDIRLVGPDSGDGPADDVLSANFYGRNGSRRAPFFFISSNGCAYANAFSEAGGGRFYEFETPIKLGEYNSYAINMNYKTHMATFEVNHHVIGALPFGGSNEGFHSVALEFAAFDDRKLVDPTLYTAYWDNIAVLAKPAN